MFETSKIFHRLRRDKAPVVIAALLSFDVAVPPAIASDILIGCAVLPATTFTPGPTSGQQLGSAPINGQAVPFVDKQPMQGFSAVADNGDGSFMVMADRLRRDGKFVGLQPAGLQDSTGLQNYAGRFGYDSGRNVN